MQFRSTVSVLFLAFSGLAQSTPTPDSQALKAGLTPFLTMTLPISIETQLITIPGGLTRTERYLNGTVTGVFNGKVYGGLAAPKIYPHPDGTLQTQTDVTLYGVTDDGEYWISRVLGVSNNVNGFVGGQLYIGGKYTNLSSEYLLGEIALDVKTNIAVAQIFLPYRK